MGIITEGSNYWGPVFGFRPLFYP